MQQSTPWWEIAAVVVSVFSLLVSVYVTGTARASNRLAEKAVAKSEEANNISREANTMSQTANAYSRESNMISQRIYEAENVPKISVSTKTYLVNLDESDHFDNLVMVLAAVVTNEGRIPIIFKNAYISIKEKDFSYGYGIVKELDKVGEQFPLPIFPYTLEGWSYFEVPASVDTIVEMLDKLHAKPADKFVISVVDSIGRKYETEPIEAKEYQHKMRVSLRPVEEPPPA